MEKVTAVVINYNGGSTVLDTIESIQNQKDVSVNVIVVDDGSTDGSPERIEEKYSDVELYQESENTKQLNKLRNEGISIAKEEKVFITDNDVILSKYCIKEMISVINMNQEIAACIPRLMYKSEKSKIYSGGGRVNYVGATTSPSRDTKSGVTSGNIEIAVGGGIALFDKKRMKGIGFFDEEYQFGWGCDGELHQRILMAGQKCVYVPSAVGYHEYKELDSSRSYRIRGQVYNRWRYILTHYSRRTLILTSPVLPIYELVQACFCLLKGVPILYLKGITDAVRSLPETLKKRQEVQSLRVVPDKYLLTAGPLYVRPTDGISGKVVSGAARALSLLFSAYWFLVRPLLADNVISRQENEHRFREPDEKHSL
jgi:GT2 family glycosyltransferase